MSEELHVGQKLVYKLRHREDPVEVYVTRIARKYFYVSSTPNGVESRVRYHKDTLCEETYYGSAAQLHTPTGWADLQRRNELYDRLQKTGVEFHYRTGIRNRLTVDQLEAIVKVVSE